MNGRGAVRSAAVETGTGGCDMEWVVNLVRRAVLDGGKSLLLFHLVKLRQLFLPIGNFVRAARGFVELHLARGQQSSGNQPLRPNWPGSERLPSVRAGHSGAELEA